MNNLRIVEMWKAYSTSEFLKSILVGLISYVLIAALVLTPTIVISLLYVPYMMYFFLGMYIALSLVASISANLFVETLQNYHVEAIDYKAYTKNSTILLAILTFIILTIIYFTVVV